MKLIKAPQRIKSLTYGILFYLCMLFTISQGLSFSHHSYNNIIKVNNIRSYSNIKLRDNKIKKCSSFSSSIRNRRSSSPIFNDLNKLISYENSQRGGGILSSSSSSSLGKDNVREEMLSLKKFLKKIKNTPEEIQFKDTMLIISQHYDYTPMTFKNGDITNIIGTNEGSCKLFSFALMNRLTENETLHLFGDIYRNLDPNKDDHQNIRNFIKYGWNGIEFMNQKNNDNKIITDDNSEDENNDNIDNNGKLSLKRLKSSISSFFFQKKLWKTNNNNQILMTTTTSLKPKSSIQYYFTKYISSNKILQKILKSSYNIVTFYLKLHVYFLLFEYILINRLADIN